MTSNPDSQKLKIVILGTAYPYRGGLAAFNERLAMALQEAGHEVEILTFTLQYPNFLFPGKSQYSEDKGPDNLKIRRVLNSVNPLSWWRTGRIIRRLKPDIILSKFWIPFIGPSLGTALRVAGKGSFRLSILDNVIPHEHRMGDKLLISYYLRSIDSFVAMSRSVMDDLRIFEPRKPCRFNPHPLYDHFGAVTARETALRKLDLDPSFRYLLFFGLIRDYKGLDILLEAFAEVRSQTDRLKLIVAGEFYSSPDPYLRIIKDKELENDVILRTEFIPDSQVADYFNAADIIVQPYKTATQSGVTQIAYHFEKPMLVTDVGGLAEIVPNGKVGYVVEPSPHAVAEAITDFFHHDRYAFMVEHVKLEKQKYSWDAMVEAILSLYRMGGRELRTDN